MYSIQSEVFSLNNTLLLLLLYVTVDMARSQHPSKAQVYLQSLLAGFAMTNQHTSVIFIAPTALWTFIALVRRGQVGLSDRRRRAGGVLPRGTFILTPLTFFSVVFVAIAGLAPYAYIVFAAWNAGYGSW